MGVPLVEQMLYNDFTEYYILYSFRTTIQQNVILYFLGCFNQTLSWL